MNLLSPLIIFTFQCFNMNRILKKDIYVYDIKSNVPIVILPPMDNYLSITNKDKMFFFYLSILTNRNSLFAIDQCKNRITLLQVVKEIKRLCLYLWHSECNVLLCRLEQKKFYNRTRIIRVLQLAKITTLFPDWLKSLIQEKG